MLEHELEGIGQLGLVVHERHAEARAVHRGLHEALRAHRVHDVGDAHVIVVAQDHVARDGDARAGVERLRDRLVRSGRARDDARSRVGNAQVLEDALNHAVLAAATMEGDEGDIVRTARKALEEIIFVGVELVDHAVTGISQRPSDRVTGIERDVPLVGNASLEHCHAHCGTVDSSHGLLLYCLPPNLADSRFPYCIYE